MPAARGDDCAATLSTPQQAAEQGGGALALAGAARLAAEAAEAGAHGIPQGLLNDAQFRMRLDDPLFARPIQAGALAGVGILHPLRSVPDQRAHVQLVVEHAATFGRRSVQRRHRPGAAPCGRHAAGVEVGGDALAAPPVRVAREYLAHDRGLLGLDLEDVNVADGHRSVAVGHAAGVAASL
nr:hypothetical protein [Thauera humireducens]